MSKPHPKTRAAFAWLLQLTVAGLLLQTLFFKLTYAPQTQVIFEPLGGRIAATGTALIELGVALMLLAPARWLSRTDPTCPRAAREIQGWTDFGAWIGYVNAVGAVAALGVIGGALFTHLAVIGIRIPVAPGSTETDGGSLFALAVFIALASAAIALLRGRELVGFTHAVSNLLHRHPEPATETIHR